MTAIDIVVTVEALVFGMAPRGDEIDLDLVFFSGTPAREIDLMEIHMEKPTLSVTTTREETKEKIRFKARFHIAPEVPLGPIVNKVTATLRVGNEEATLSIPVQGEAVGDVRGYAHVAPTVHPACALTHRSLNDRGAVHKMAARVLVNVKNPCPVGRLLYRIA